MTQGLKVTLDTCAKFAYEVAVGMAGGVEKLSSEQLDAMARECAGNQNLKTFSGMYLVGDSTRAEYNFNNLVGELRRVFYLTLEGSN